MKNFNLELNCILATYSFDIRTLNLNKSSILRNDVIQIGRLVQLAKIDARLPRYQTSLNSSVLIENRMVLG